MKTVSLILNKKGRDIFSVAPDATVFEALEIMADKNIGALLVLEDDKLAGIFSERDYARKIILKGKTSKGTSVRDLMTRDVLYVSPDTTVEECMVIMAAKHVRHLPVFENDKLTGLISSSDVVDLIISEQKSTIEALERYIRSSL